MARTLLSATSITTWGAEQRRAVEHYVDKVDDSVKLCSKGLHAVTRARAKERGEPYGRWIELGEDLLRYFQDWAGRTGSDWEIWTQQSNVQNIDLEQFDKVIPPFQAKAKSFKITSDPSNCKAMLGGSEGGGVIMWAPSDADALSRLLHGYERYATEWTEEMGTDPQEIALIAAHEPVPGATRPSDITDVWQHTLLRKSWDHVIKRVEFLRQPAQCVVPGAAGPLHQYKTVAVFLLSARQEAVPPVINSWRRDRFQVGKATYLVVDCRSADRMAIQRALGRVRDRTILWEGPLRSGAHTTQAPRITFRGYVDEQNNCSLTSQARTAAVKEDLASTGAIVGCATLYTDPSAIVAELTEPDALCDLADLATEAVFVSPKVALLIPEASHAEWEVALTTQNQETPSKSVKSLRWRQSRHGGKVFAAPSLLARDARAGRERERANRHGTGNAQTEDPRKTALIILRGSLGANPKALAQTIMDAVQDSIGKTLTHTPRTRHLQPGSWKEITDGNNSWNGTIRVHTETEEDVSKMMDEVHNESFQLNGEHRCLEVYNAFCTRRTQTQSTNQGNGRGAAGQAPPPPRGTGRGR